MTYWNTLHSIGVTRALPINSDVTELSTQIYLVTILIEVVDSPSTMRTLICLHKLKFDVYHEARQKSQLFSPDRFRCFW